MPQSDESTRQFEERKRDHIQLALSAENEAVGASGFDSIRLWHEALPDLNFSDVELTTQILNKKRKTPFLVSSMTAGHADSTQLNQRLAQACAAQGWLMGVGSQRRELNDYSIRSEWRDVRNSAPGVALLGNLGLSQLIQTTNEQIQALVDVLEAEAMIVHLNPLQECLQPEGTPNFQGGWARLKSLIENLNVPVIVKETGCGFSPYTLKQLNELGVSAVDVSGYGGTHWGRIEGKRSGENSLLAEVSATFSNWGVSTVDSLLAAREIAMQSKFKHNSHVPMQYEVWASGGVRSGLDAAKALALGAVCVGYAKPILQAALIGYDELIRKMQTIEYELRTALFCTGCINIGALENKKVLR